MSLEFAILLISMTFGAVSPVAYAPVAIRKAIFAPVAFRTDDRVVGNWRLESFRNLSLDNAAMAAIIGGREPTGLPRCVKLNNYWCIKGAGWNGMLAADAEGHAAFSSATEGAAVAALLLRRYYLEFSRRSANDIVSRWAPPQCGAPVARATKGFGIAQARNTLGPDPRLGGPALTTRGIGATLRAHFLAVKRMGRRAGARPALSRSAVPDRVGSLIRAPTIAAGFGETAIAMPALRLASLGSTGPLPTFSSCALDGQRLRNYAAKVIEGVAASPDEDLKLFEPDGTPDPRLRRLMENMAGVEIGPYKPASAVVRRGIETATNALRAARAAELRPTSAPEAEAPR